LLVVAVILHSRVSALGLLTIALIAAVVLSRLPVGRIARELRLFALLLVLMFVVRSFAADTGPYFAIGALKLSRKGMEAAGILVWRLVLLLLYGTLFAATTRGAHLQASVAWYLRPFRFIPGARIATMVGLTVALIPLVFDSYNEVADAQRARCVERIKNPVRRVRGLAVPLILKTFGRADSLAAAIESRCYSDARSFAPLRARPSDWVTAFIVLLVAASALCANRLM
jgi:energy-coupling factor transporter transmembrane protein EcfT